MNHLRGRGVVAALCGAVVLLLASCGPRYERTDATTADNATELSPATGATELGGAVPSGQTTTAGVRGATTSTSGSTPQTTTGGPPAGAPKPGSLAGQTYRGVTAQAVTVGVMASQTINEGYEALGAAGASFPDPVKQVEPIVKWINEHGGVAGRKLQVAWHFRDDLSQDTDDTKMQQACTDFTQDKKVFLVTSIYQAHGMAPCLRDNDVTLIESGAGPAQFGTPTYDTLGGYYVTPNQISVRRYSVALVQGLHKRGYFSGGAKVGLVYMGFPYAQSAVRDGLKPELKRLGVTLVDEQELRPIERASDFAGTQAEVSNAVLRFKQKGINRIISLEDQATTIMSAAEQQDYYPRYGLGSLSLFGASDSNPDSMKDSTIVGFNVQLDVLPRYRGASPALEKTCRKIYLDSRQAPDDELAWGLMEWHCEGFFFIKAALDGMREVSSKGLIASIESLGTSYPSFTTYGMRLAANRYDGVAMARPLKFVPDCTCIRYAGSAYAIP